MHIVKSKTLIVFKKMSLISAFHYHTEKAFQCFLQATAMKKFMLKFQC